MRSSHLSEHLEDNVNLKRFQQEVLLLDVASLIYSTMKNNGITRKQLAEELGVTKSRISHYLGGEKNLTLRTLADIFTALSSRLRVESEAYCDMSEWYVLSKESKTLKPQPKSWTYLRDSLDVNPDVLALAG